MSDLEWQDPAPSKTSGSGTKWSRIGDQLRANPSRWAIVRSGASNTVAGTYAKRALGPEFEVTTRTTPGGVDVYARFVGSES